MEERGGEGSQVYTRFTVHYENLSKHLPLLGDSDVLVGATNKMVLNLESFRSELILSGLSSFSSSTLAIDILLV